MSVYVSGAAWNADLPRPEKFVLLAMADHADHEGENVRPSVALVAYKTGYGRSSVLEAQHALRERGILEVVEVRQAEGKPTLYRINTDRIPLLPSFRKPRPETGPAPVQKLDQPPSRNWTSPRPETGPQETSVESPVEKQNPQTPAGAGGSVAGMGLVPSFSADGTKPKASEPQPEDEGFDEAWALYPCSNTPNRMAALKAWRARIREGIPPADLLAGVRSYAASVARKGTKPKFVKMAATFFGPNRWWEIDYADDEIAGVESMLRRESAADDYQPQQPAPVAEHQPSRHPLQYTAVDERTPLERLRWHLFRYCKEEALELKVELGLLGQTVEDRVMGRSYEPYPEEFEMLAGCS